MRLVLPSYRQGETAHGRASAYSSSGEQRSIEISASTRYYEARVEVQHEGEFAEGRLSTAAIASRTLRLGFVRGCWCKKSPCGVFNYAVTAAPGKHLRAHHGHHGIGDLVLSPLGHLGVEVESRAEPHTTHE